MSEAQKRNWLSHPGLWGMVVVTVLGCAMIGYAARPVKVELPTATLTPSSVSDYSIFNSGTSIASSADGSIVVVGANGSVYSSSETGAGVAYVYLEPAHGGWGHTLPAPSVLEPPAAYQLGGLNFGYSVAIDGTGNRIVVGAPGNNGTLDGTAWVFNEPSGGWAAGTTYTATDSSPDNLLQAGDTSASTGTPQFGYSVAISSDGNTVVVGAPHQNVTVTGPSNTTVDNAGTGYVFEYSGGSWGSGLNLYTFSGLLIPPTGAGIGTSVAVNGGGTRIALGVPRGSLNLNDSGAVYTYSRANTNSSWTVSLGLTEPTGPYVSGDEFGQSVAFDQGSTLVIGAPGRNNNKGEAYIFFKPVSQDWSLVANLTSPAPVAGSQFGYVLAFSNDGTKVAVGSRATGSNVGVLYQFDEPSKGKTLLGWPYNSHSPSGIFEASTSDTSDGFVTSAAIGLGKDVWVFGGANTATSGQGAAYAFQSR